MFPPCQPSYVDVVYKESVLFSFIILYKKNSYSQKYEIQQNTE